MQTTFPNEFTKKSEMVLSRGIMQDFFKYGLLMRFNTEILTNTLLISASWKTKEVFEMQKNIRTSLSLKLKKCDFYYNIYGPSKIDKLQELIFKF